MFKIKKLFFDFSKFRPGPGGSILIQSLVFLSWFTASKKNFLFQHFPKLYFPKYIFGGLSIHSLPSEVVKKNIGQFFF